MNKCPQYTDQSLLAYLQNQMDREATDRLQFHLTQCAVCRERLDGLRRLSGSLTEVMTEDITETETEPSTSLSPRKNRSGWYAAASILLVIGLGIAGYQIFLTDSGVDPSINPSDPLKNGGDFECPIDSCQIHEKDSILKKDSVFEIVIE